MSGDNSQPSFLCHNNELVYDAEARATLFNDFFHSVFTSSDFILPSHSFPAPSFPCISELSLDPSEVYTILAQLDITKAMGCDNLHPSVFKHCADLLADPITFLFNWSLEFATFPLNGKYIKFDLYQKVEIKAWFLITGQFHFSVLSLRCSKRLFSMKSYNMWVPSFQSVSLGLLRADLVCLNSLLHMRKFIVTSIMVLEVLMHYFSISLRHLILCATQ